MTSTLATALVLLSESDPEAPALPGVATVSKDDDFDDGAFDIGAEAASRGAVWTDRPYVTGNPTVEWMVERIDRAVAAGCASIQVLNEVNLPLENWQGGPEAYASYYAELRAARPDATLLYQPPSPGVPGWEGWVADNAPAYGVHAYGSDGQMRAVVQWYLDSTAGELWITELNPGAGNTFDLTAWAYGELDPFLNWCATQPRIRCAAFFAWKWDQSGSLPSSVDACDCPAVVEVLAKQRVPPMNGGANGETWYPSAAQRPISCNYTPGRGGQTVGVIVDHVADGMGSPYGWFNTPRGDQGSSAHFWVSKTGQVEQYRPLEDTAWANGPIADPDLDNPSVAAIVASGVDPNQVSVAIEHEGYPGEAFPEAQGEASRALHLWLANLLELLLTRDQVIGHDQLDAVTRANCPGPTFPWDAVLAGGAPAPDPIVAVRDQVWALAEQAEQLGHPWFGQNLKSAVAQSKGEA